MKRSTTLEQIVNKRLSQVLFLLESEAVPTAATIRTVKSLVETAIISVEDKELIRTIIAQPEESKLLTKGILLGMRLSESAMYLQQQDAQTGALRGG